MDIVTFLQGSPAAFAGAMLVVGLVIGSFLNVVIHRLPLILDRQWRAQCAELEGRDSDDTADVLSLAAPRSRCPACMAPIKAWQNVPVVSWILLGGRCASCRTRISLRYPAVELATGIMSAVVAWHFGFGFEATCALAITWMLIPLTGIDLDTQLLPDLLTIPLLWLGLLASLWHDPASTHALPVSPRDAIVGAAAGYLFLWGIFHAFKLLTGKEGMGYGDFKLFAALGAWFGWQMLPLILLLSAAVGAAVGITLIVARGRDRNVPIPYGPYLAGAGWIAMMWGPAIMGSYLAVSGLR